MVEKAPQIKGKDLMKAMKTRPSDEMAALIDKINAKYEYWDSVKYKKVPDPYTPADLWTYVVADRMKTDVRLSNKYHIHFSLTNTMQRQCHEMDMNFGGSWGASSILPDDKERYLISSLMEEAIASSMMEGASTTRKFAKEMLRKKMTPRDKSQQMIHNNYQTIRFLVENKDMPLSAELLLQVHRLMTEKTLENAEDAGRFRTNNNVVVENGITHEIVHTPPPFEEIPEFIDQLCTFFNEDRGLFIHPIIKGIIIHFMLAYIHPFADGNGRTSRAVFYWYMLRKGYWLTEYLSISRIIARSKNAYEKAFLYAEADGNDIGYFIAYNLRVLGLAFQDLQAYIKRKSDEKQAASVFLQIENINMRQAEIIRIFTERPKEVLTVKDLQAKFGVSPTTAKTDIIGLLERGIVKEISFNKVKKGYIKGENFMDY